VNICSSIRGVAVTAGSALASTIVGVVGTFVIATHSRGIRVGVVGTFAIIVGVLAAIRASAARWGRSCAA